MIRSQKGDQIRALLGRPEPVHRDLLPEGGREVGVFQDLHIPVCFDHPGQNGVDGDPVRRIFPCGGFGEIHQRGFRRTVDRQSRRGLDPVDAADENHPAVSLFAHLRQQFMQQDADTLANDFLQIAKPEKTADIDVYVCC